MIRRCVFVLIGTWFFAGAALAQNCSSYPYVISNSTTVEASQLMANHALNCATSGPGPAPRATVAPVPSSGGTIQFATTVAYDQLNRPIGVTWVPAPTAVTPAGASVTFTHGYNAANQRISQTASDKTWLEYPSGLSSTTYTANALNQYTAVGSVTPTYDANGNLTFDGTFTFAYDAENRLISASGAGNTVSYSYDAQGRRKSKTVNGATTIFVTDADNREVLEYDGSTGQILAWYVYATGSNEVLNRMDVVAGTRQTLIPDIQGSFVGTLDSATGTLTKRAYLPYGESATTSGTFAYTGLRIDPETNGLYYARARIYSPVLGRFVQRDPIGYAGGSNLYAYVGNDPLNGIDLTGEVVWFLPLATGAVGGVAGGVGYVFGKGVTGGAFSVRDFGIAVGVGAVAGAAAPFTATTLTGAALTGAAANVAQGSITAVANSRSYSPTQAVIDAGTGAVGGMLGGAFTRSVGYGRTGTALPDYVDTSNIRRDLLRNVTYPNVARNVLGNIGTTVGGDVIPSASESQPAATRYGPATSASPKK